MTSLTYTDTVFGRLERHAQERPELTVYTYLDDGREAEALTCAQLSARVRTIAARLGERARPGERALLLYPQGLEFICAFLGCLAAGVIAVPAYPSRKRGKSERLNGIVADCTPTILLTASSLRKRIAEQHGALPIVATDEWTTCDAPAWPRERIERQTTAFLQYSSGSTGTPNGVMVTHEALVANIEQCATALDSRGNEIVMVSWLPTYHDMGLVGGALAPFYLGGKAVLMSPDAFLRKPVRWLEAITSERATLSCCPNFALDLCVRRVRDEEVRRLDLSSLRAILNGAEPVRADTIDRFCEKFAPAGFRPEAMFPSFGLAEATVFVSGGPLGGVPRRVRVDAVTSEPIARPTCAAVATGETFAPRGPEKWAVSCGAPAVGARVVAVDPATKTVCPDGKTGEIWVQSPSMSAGYWGKPELTERTFCNFLANGDGPFLNTGDLGCLLEGELYISGRGKDVIILRGRNLYPQDVERVVEQTLPFLGANACAAFSTNGADSEELTLLIEADRDLIRAARDAEQDASAAVKVERVVADLRRAIAGEFQTVVRAVAFVRPGAFPRTSSGKLQRHRCRELIMGGNDAVDYLWERSQVTIAAQTGDDLLKIVRDCVVRVLELPPGTCIAADDNLHDFGMDSIMATELLFHIEEALNCSLPMQAITKSRTIAQIVTMVQPKRNGPTGPRYS